MNERAEILDCQGDKLVAVVHEPPETGELGLVIIVAGGPQYRVGANRQFVLLARKISSSGIPVIRFDHRGTGDSDGAYRGFMDMDDDIACGVDYLFENYPDLKQVALWGECESASAAAYYTQKDSRIGGIFLVNPWVRTEAGLAKTYLKHHYRTRLFDPEFWKKVASGKFSIAESFASFIHLIKQSRRTQLFDEQENENEAAKNVPLTSRLEKCLLDYNKEIAVVTSGRDHIAREYKDFVNSSKVLQRHLSKRSVMIHEIRDSDHTFSRSEWREELFETTLDWLKKIRSPSQGK